MFAVAVLIAMKAHLMLVHKDFNMCLCDTIEGGGGEGVGVGCYMGGHIGVIPYVTCCARMWGCAAK